MNPSTAQAEVLVDELVRNGVCEVVLSPGSRNAPLSFALHRATEAGRLRLHVRVDERSAGFLALGLAARSGHPVAVVCTSGTATTNLHPAVSEAWHSGVPLIVLTADRPPELRAAGANQTIDQHRLYGTAVRLFDELAVAENRPGQNAYWRTQVCRACHAAGSARGRGGPVHLNVPLREPLVPDGDPDWCEPLRGRPDAEPWTRLAGDESPASALSSVRSPHGVVLLADDHGDEAAQWAEQLGWPVLSEIGGVGLGGANAVAAGMWLLDLPGFLDDHRPEQVVCVGRPTVFRQVQRLLADRGAEMLLVHGAGSGWPAPGQDVREVAQTLGSADVAVDPGWLAAWQRADHKVRAALHAALDAEDWASGPVVARDVIDALPPEALFVPGSSNPARDVALAARHRPDVVVHRNRGVAGIDGTVSTAMGSALAHGGPAYALLGDLTFLHDSNGLLLGPAEQRPDLTMVVFNDDGGGIFSLLEQGGPEYGESFERIFGTPHGTDLAALCAAHGVEHVAAHRRSELLEALRPRSGLRVVEVRSDRARLRGAHERLRAAVSSAFPGE
ncbi:2-succinyl-5-enolpyruvyl-6-hydroxy-3-cyclohexene-1-carboxylate synthase [Halopolyspora algeriensis]|uniref:2-succinyl-5-enolpyruvyl-6-hydroxy-3-cyclohexene-1-carboxylate synthase n=1 Tax=Halopolyspora algeriensis TaxID=1500506 RepID=A0A368VY17_9ACTN|nr:2-succinyl-5-enolpyruvyl-6-hydroxy-3-cyclohexene-1-carboxylic-acid synthase [Halopolyspora algeriensis]RCW46877.1 2-succinyl-5-enolpyruvyl-6-hydroxy-3-cyclohexene-1-carboxylate synthase [Halopolyspora algeriensis]TQM47968.1 2-succinyl-5-enolpyruvyl-6-hydroxy-3-cyclohexene-1-carboxylate synthase [Halopolyspora algeriensis]